MDNEQKEKMYVLSWTCYYCSIYLAGNDCPIKI